MRFTILPLIAFCACAANTPGQAGEPVARVVHGDLALDDAADRAKLRGRVADAARAFCAKHGGEVTPDALRNDGFYCLERVRDTIVTDMPSDIRAAYRRAMSEAGVRGRRL